MAETTPSENMLRMQQEAVRRVRMMQDKTVKAVSPIPETAQTSSSAVSSVTQAETKQPCDTAADAHRDIGLSSLINGSNSEELLLLILLLLLSDEKTEPALIMAVLYLML